MNKFKIIFKKIKFKLVALFGLLTIGCGCLLSNNSYAWFVNDEGNLQSSNLLNPSYISQDIEVNSRWSNTLVFSLQTFENNQVYTLSFNILTSGSVNLVCTCRLNDGTYTNEVYSGSVSNNELITYTFTKTSNMNVLWVQKADTSNNSIKTINQMLVKGSIAMAFDPYGKVYYNNQYVSPWKVNSEGNLESLNLYYSSNDVTYSFSGGGFRFIKGNSLIYTFGHNSSSSDAIVSVNLFENLPIDKTYTLSFDYLTYQNKVIVYELINNGSVIKSSSNGVFTINLTQDYRDNSTWRFKVPSMSSFDSFTPFIRVMISEGSSAFEYAPYGAIFYNSSYSSNLQSDLDTLQDKYNLLETNYNDLKADYDNLHIDLDSANQELQDYLDTISRLNSDNATLTNLVNTLRSQVEDNFTWQNLFFTMADTPFRVVANALGFNIFGINLFATFIGLTTTLAIIFLVKKFI